MANPQSSLLFRYQFPSIDHSSIPTRPTAAPNFMNALKWLLLLILLATPASAQKDADLPAFSFERKVRTTQKPTGNGFDWKTVEAADYRQYIANLRRIGCPEKTIQDIVFREIGELYETKEAELNPRKPGENWQLGGRLFGQPVKPQTPELLRKVWELQWEKRRLLVALLGTAPEDSYTMKFLFLPDRQKFQAADLFQSVYRARMIASGTTRIEITPALDHEVETVLAKLLSPEQRLQYEMENSVLANMMRGELSSFEPTEKEFFAIYKLRKPIWEKYPNSSEANPARTAALAATNEQVKTLLGEARYRDYQRCHDFHFQKWYDLAARQVGLNRDAAIKFYEIMSGVGKKADEIRAGILRANQDPKVPLSRETQEAVNQVIKDALRKLRQETEKSIQALFGEKQYEAFKKNPFAKGQVDWELGLISRD